MSKRLFVLIILFVIVIAIESILIIHIVTHSEANEPHKEKTIDEIKENEDIKKLRSMPYKHGQIIEVIYSNNDEETGSIDEIIFSRVTSSYHLTTKERKDKSKKTNIKEYTVDPPDYTKILNYLAEYNLPAWSTLPDKKDYTGPNKTVKFYYNDSAYKKGNKELYEVGFNKEFPTDGHKIVLEFINILYNSVKEKNLLKQDLIN